MMASNVLTASNQDLDFVNLGFSAYDVCSSIPCVSSSMYIEKQASI